MKAPLGRSLTLVVLLALPIVSQGQDTSNVPPPDSVAPEIKPPISPRRAFLSSLVLPGYSQSVLGRSRSGAMILAMEALSIVMVRETALGLREARRNAVDSVVVSYVNPNGVPDECECVADWNRDGISNSTDVSDFINTFFADQTSGGLNGDVNCDGTSNSTDVSDFINIWFAAQAGQLPFAGCSI